MFTELPTRNVGDVFTADPMWNTYLRDNMNKGVVRPIAQATLAADAASIDFASIAADWEHLLLVVYARSAIAATGDDLLVRFNGDTGTNYNLQVLDASGTTVTATETIGTGSGLLIGRCPGANAPTLAFGHAEARIPHYAGATNHKALSAYSSRRTADASGGQSVHLSGGQWKSAAAITQVTLRANGGNLVAGTRATLYGMGGI